MESEGMDVVGKVKRYLGLGVIAFVLLFLLFFTGRMFESVSADEIVVIQDPVDGELHWYTTAGLKWQNFGTSTSYPKRATYEANQTARFNDGGHGTMVDLTVQWEMPLDAVHLTELHTKFGPATCSQIS